MQINKQQSLLAILLLQVKNYFKPDSSFRTSCIDGLSDDLAVVQRQAISVTKLISSCNDFEGSASFSA